MQTKILQEIIKYIHPGKPIICFDYGTKKIGMAMTTPDHSICMPRKTILKHKDIEQIESCCQEIKNYNVCVVVVGLPLNMDGSLNNQTQKIEEFAAKLAKQSGVAVFLQDERMTSRAADNLLKNIGFNRKARNSKDDAIAANLILETFVQLLKISTL